MIDTNADLRRQRDVIGGIDDKNRAISRNIDQTNVIVKQMTKKEFCQKIWIIVVIGLLGFADLLILLKKVGII